MGRSNIIAAVINPLLSTFYEISAVFILEGVLLAYHEEKSPEERDPEPLEIFPHEALFLALKPPSPCRFCTSTPLYPVINGFSGGPIAAPFLARPHDGLIICLT